MSRPIPARLRGQHYDEAMRRGFVVRAGAFTRPDGLPAAPSYWYGPEHGWGTTSGGLGYSVRVFGSRAAAAESWARYYGGSRRKPIIDTLAEARSMIATHRKIHQPKETQQ